MAHSFIELCKPLCHNKAMIQEGVFHKLICQLYILFIAISVYVFRLFSNWLACLFSLWSFESSFSYVFYIPGPCQLCDQQIFSSSVFILFRVSFLEKKDFILNDPIYLFFFFMDHVFGVKSKNSLLSPRSSRFSFFSL